MSHSCSVFILHKITQTYAYDRKMGRSGVLPNKMRTEQCPRCAFFIENSIFLFIWLRSQQFFSAIAFFFRLYCVMRVRCLRTGTQYKSPKSYIYQIWKWLVYCLPSYCSASEFVCHCHETNESGIESRTIIHSVFYMACVCVCLRVWHSVFCLL